MLEFCELLALLLVVDQGPGHDNEGLMCYIQYWHVCMSSGGAQHGRGLTIVMRAGENEVLQKYLVMC